MGYSEVVVGEGGGGAYLNRYEEVLSGQLFIFGPSSNDMTHLQLILIHRVDQDMSVPGLEGCFQGDRRSAYLLQGTEQDKRVSEGEMSLKGTNIWQTLFQHTPRCMLCK